jgi:hypothetical protein
MRLTQIIAIPLDLISDVKIAVTYFLSDAYEISFEVFEFKHVDIFEKCK